MFKTAYLRLKESLRSETDRIRGIIKDELKDETDAPIHYHSKNF